MKNKIGFCLVSMFTPRVVAIKMPKIAHFFFISADGSKKSVTFGKNILVHLKDLF